MKKNDALSKFEANLFTLIKSYQNSNLISDSIVLEITNLYNNFKAKVTKNYDKHSRLIERIAWVLQLLCYKSRLPTRLSKWPAFFYGL